MLYTQLSPNQSCSRQPAPNNLHDNDDDDGDDDDNDDDDDDDGDGKE